jgi:hydroxyacylglutathione hydrolase
MPGLRAAVVPVTPFQQNCTLLWDEDSKRGAVIDPGGEVDRILAAIREAGFSLEMILLTHGHIDHAGGAAELRDSLRREDRGGDEPSCPIIGPDERDRFLLQGIEQQARAYGLSGVRNVVPDRWLKEGDTVEVGSHRFDVLYCPGHTPGHIVFVNPGAASPLWATFCFRARSVAPTSLMGITRR